MCMILDLYYERNVGTILVTVQASALDFEGR